MDNNGCFVPLIGSVKMLRENLESVRGQIDQRVYQNSMKELDAMQVYMEGLMRDRGLSFPARE